MVQPQANEWDKQNQIHHNHYSQNQPAQKKISGVMKCIVEATMM